MVLLDVVHPPAMATAGGFAFVSRRRQVIRVFLLTLVLMTALEWALHRGER